MSIIYSFNTYDKDIIVFEKKFPEFTALNKRFKWYIMIGDVLHHLEFDRVENDVRFFKNGSSMDTFNMILIHSNIMYQCVKSDEHLINSLNNKLIK